MTKKRFGIARTGFWAGLHPGMALASKGMVLAFLLFTVLNVDAAGTFYSGIRRWIEATLSWYYILAVCAMLFACLYLACSRHGKVRLGDDDSRPEFSTFSWLAMLFSAGVGIGLLFFSIAEPMVYFDNSALQGHPNNPHADHAGAVQLDERRAVHALQVTYFHWGLHAWAVYVMTGLCLAYFGFRKKLPFTLRSALYPVIGERIYGPIGHGVDLLAVFGTVFGVATSLGLGVKQMAVGLHSLFGLPPGIVTQLALIVVISIAATISAVSGVGRGIRVISEWNIYLSIVLVGFFLLFGPFEWLMGFFATSVGAYLWNVVPMGFWTAAEDGAPGVAGQLDHLLLGLVDRLGAVRRPVHRPHLARTAHSRVHRRRNDRPHLRGARLDLRFRRQCAVHGTLRRGRPRQRRTDGDGPRLAARSHALRHHRAHERPALADLDHVRAGDAAARHLVHHVIGLRHAGHRHDAEHGR